MSVKVAVEAIVHDALRSALQMIATEYGVVVKEVSVNWEVVTPIAAPTRYYIGKIEITSFTTHRSSNVSER